MIRGRSHLGFGSRRDRAGPTGPDHRIRTSNPAPGTQANQPHDCCKKQAKTSPRAPSRPWSLLAARSTEGAPVGKSRRKRRRESFPVHHLTAEQPMVLKRSYPRRRAPMNTRSRETSSMPTATAPTSIPPTLGQRLRELGRKRPRYGYRRLTPQLGKRDSV